MTIIPGGLDAGNTDVTTWVGQREDRGRRMMGMTKAELHQLVDELAEGSLDGAALLLGQLVRGEVDPEHAWVWTNEWQERLRSSLANVAAGRTQRFDSSEAFLASL